MLAECVLELVGEVLGRDIVGTAEGEIGEAIVLGVEVEVVVGVGHDEGVVFGEILDVDEVLEVVAVFEHLGKGFFPL